LTNQSTLSFYERRELNRAILTDCEERRCRIWENMGVLFVFCFYIWAWKPIL